MSQPLKTTSAGDNDGRVAADLHIKGVYKCKIDYMS
jgi:hypothetical protein